MKGSLTLNDLGTDVSVTLTSANSSVLGAESAAAAEAEHEIFTTQNFSLCSFFVFFFWLCCDRGQRGSRPSRGFIRELQVPALEGLSLTQGSWLQTSPPSRSPWPLAPGPWGTNIPARLCLLS